MCTYVYVIIWKNKYSNPKNTTEEKIYRDRRQIEKKSEIKNVFLPPIYQQTHHPPQPYKKGKKSLPFVGVQLHIYPSL